MLKDIAVLIACSLSCLVLAHEHCHYDEWEVDPDGELTYCSMEYVTSGTCCNAEEEAALEVTFNAAGLPAECAYYYKQVGSIQKYVYLFTQKRILYTVISGYASGVREDWTRGHHNSQFSRQLSDIVTRDIDLWSARI